MFKQSLSKALVIRQLSVCKLSKNSFYNPFRKLYLCKSTHRRLMIWTGGVMCLGFKLYYSITASCHYKPGTFNNRGHPSRIVTKSSNIWISIWSFFRHVLRLIKLIFIFTPIIYLYILTLIIPSFTRTWYAAMLWALETAGPTFIKLGQWASTRRDLFSVEFCNTFAKLHDSTQQHSWAMTKTKLRRAFGKRWRELFARIERTPIGSGCVGQVYKAYMYNEKIPDKSLIEEVLHTDDSEDPAIDFALGELFSTLNFLKTFCFKIFLLF